MLLKVIVFKYPFARLEAIAASWTKEVVWEGLGTANFTLFKTIPVSYTHLDVYKRQITQCVITKEAVEGTGKPMVVRREKQGLLDGFKEAK